MLVANLNNKGHSSLRFGVPLRSIIKRLKNKTIFNDWQLYEKKKQTKLKN